MLLHFAKNPHIIAVLAEYCEQEELRTATLLRQQLLGRLN